LRDRYEEIRGGLRSKSMNKRRHDELVGERLDASSKMARERESNPRPNGNLSVPDERIGPRARVRLVLQRLWTLLVLVPVRHPRPRPAHATSLTSAHELPRARKRAESKESGEETPTDLSYWTGLLTTTPSSSAHLSTKHGSRSSSRAIMHTSACEVARMCSIWSGEVSRPTVATLRAEVGDSAALMWAARWTE
jgi:hypothetical protein